MNITVFYAWQSDRPRLINRDLIREAAESACQSISEDSRNPWNVEIDSDTQDEPGMCDIPQTILKKIRNADIVLADLTFVTNADSGKKIPNPNVVFELGYAAKHVGFHSLVAVMNSAFGNPEGQIFDIKRRACIRYRCAEGSTDRAKIVRELADDLVDAFSRTIRDVVEKKRRQKLLADDNVFQATRTAFADRVTHNQFHDFQFSPAALVVIGTKPQSDMDLKAAFAKLNDRGLNPKIVADTIIWQPDDKTRRYELTIGGTLFHAYGGDHESWKREYAHNRLAQRIHAEKYGKTPPPFIRSFVVQANLIRHVHESCTLLQDLGLPLPCRIGLSLVRANGVKIILSDSELSEPSRTRDIHLKSIIFQKPNEFADKPAVARALRNAMDEMCRHFQQVESRHFNSSGDWTGDDL